MSFGNLKDLNKKADEAMKVSAFSDLDRRATALLAGMMGDSNSIPAATKTAEACGHDDAYGVLGRQAVKIAAALGRALSEEES